MADAVADVLVYVVEDVFVRPDAARVEAELARGALWVVDYGSRSGFIY